MIDVNTPSNRELWLETNTTPSKSLEEDMVETLERMHHRAVAALQMRFHARIEKVTEEAQVFQNQVTYAHPWAGFQEWNPREEDAVETWVMIERSKLEKMLDNLDILLEFKKKQIRERVA